MPSKRKKKALKARMEHALSEDVAEPSTSTPINEITARTSTMRIGDRRYDAEQAMGRVHDTSSVSFSAATVQNVTVIQMAGGDISESINSLRRNGLM
jgi:hypothetical protein